MEANVCFQAYDLEYKKMCNDSYMYAFFAYLKTHSNLTNDEIFDEIFFASTGYSLPCSTSSVIKPPEKDVSSSGSPTERYALEKATWETRVARCGIYRIYHVLQQLDSISAKEFKRAFNEFNPNSEFNVSSRLIDLALTADHSLTPKDINSVNLQKRRKSLKGDTNYLKDFINSEIVRYHENKQTFFLDEFVLAGQKTLKANIHELAENMLTNNALRVKYNSRSPRGLRKKHKEVYQLIKSQIYAEREVLQAWKA